MNAKAKSTVWLAKGQDQLPEPPYSHDVRAKGWMFNLDCERMRQSDTWVLTEKPLRPWLVMIWITAWMQTPCGSLPADDELIAAHIGMELRQFSAHRDLLMRGWYMASDGRLYHSYITSMVVEMMTRKTRETQRKGEYRQRKEEERRLKAEAAREQKQGLAAFCPVGHDGDRHGTDADATWTDVGVTTPIPIPIPIPTGKVVLFGKGGVGGSSPASPPDGGCGQDDHPAGEPELPTVPEPPPAASLPPPQPAPAARTTRPRVSRAAPASPPASEAPFDADDAAMAAAQAQEATTDKAHPLPLDWALPMSWGNWAMDANEGMGWSRERTLAEAAKFRDYWRGKATIKDGRKSDWKSTWRNWCRNAAEFGPKAPMLSRPASARVTASSLSREEWKARGERLAAKMGAKEGARP